MARPLTLNPPSWLLMLMVWLGLWSSPSLSRAEAGSSVETQDYLEPATLKAVITGLGNTAKGEVFSFRRTALRDNSTVRVRREFARAGGTVVTREEVVYVAGQLMSIQLDEPLSGAHGRVTVQLNAGNAKSSRLQFEYTSETGSRKTGSEDLEPDTLVNDMVGPFIASHWQRLTNGEAVKSRYIALSRAETVGFKFVRESETTWQGRRAVVIRMQPTSWIIAQIVKPLRFVVDCEAPHHVLQYTGRTTPRAQKGKHWEDVDAVTVFEWPETGNRNSTTNAGSGEAVKR